MFVFLRATAEGLVRLNGGGGGGGRCMGDLVRARIFFPKRLSGDRIFADIQRCKIFFSIINHEKYYFSV